MSGLLAVWNSQQPTPWKAMLEDLTVLGKDGIGDWHDREAGLSLGRTQFFNTPESCSEAPVIEAEGCVLVWDGRLDDRARLLAGRSHVSDAQLLIEGYRRWGADCIRHLIGEYVFILWDKVNQGLVVGCDKVGGCTIGYYWDGATLLLSSRLLTLLRHPQVSRDFDEVYFAHVFCTTTAQMPGTTPFKALKRLVPGTALILQQGQLRTRTIDQLVPPQRYYSPKSAEQQYEQFWHLLNAVVKDRLRTHRAVGATLSGGLDSTTVTVALLNHLPRIDTFSAVTDRFAEFDERKPIQSFLDFYPQVTWHPTNTDRDWAFSEPWDQLPAIDDPAAFCTLGLNLKVMATAQRCNIGLMFDGDWGDELCYTSLRTQLKGGCWGQVFDSVRTASHRWSLIRNNFILPYLPPSLALRWKKYRLQQDGFLPDWINPDYLQSEAIQTALEQYAQVTLQDSQVETFRYSIERGGAVGATQAVKLIRSSYQLAGTSPMQDQRLLEFAAQIHPALQSSREHGKLFLRQVDRGHLPEDVRLRPKENYFDPLKYAGIGEGQDVLDLLESMRFSSFMNDRINFKKVESTLIEYRAEYASRYSSWTPISNKVSNRMLSLFSLHRWLNYQKNHSFCFSKV